MNDGLTDGSTVRVPCDEFAPILEEAVQWEDLY